MSETSHQKISTVNIDEAMFQPFPSEVIFQNFEPFETYEVPLVLRNGDKVYHQNQGFHSVIHLYILLPSTFIFVTTTAYIVVDDLIGSSLD